MQIEQAVVSSVDSRTDQKNEVVSRSPNIDDKLGRNLCDWSPSRLDLAFGQTESLSFFPTDNGKFAISRSVIGGLQSSRCGGRRIVSYIVLVDPTQLSRYRNNAVLLTRVLLSMGKLLLQTNGNPKLPLLDIPDRNLLEPSVTNCPELAIETEKIVRAIEIHRQVVIIGKPNPVTFLGEFLAELPLKDRTRYSFTTGLNVVEERPFTLQFFPEATSVLEKQFATLQLRTINVKPANVNSY